MTYAEALLLVGTAWKQEYWAAPITLVDVYLADGFDYGVAVYTYTSDSRYLMSISEFALMIRRAPVVSP